MPAAAVVTDTSRVRISVWQMIIREKARMASATEYNMMFTRTLMKQDSET